jgi:hypothetical protein
LRPKRTGATSFCAKLCPLFLSHIDLAGCAALSQSRLCKFHCHQRSQKVYVSDFERHSIDRCWQEPLECNVGFSALFQFMHKLLFVCYFFRVGRGKILAG